MRHYLPGPGFCLVIKKCRINGNGHGQRNANVNRKGNARGKDNGRDNSNRCEGRTNVTLTATSHGGVTSR